MCILLWEIAKDLLTATFSLLKFMSQSSSQTYISEQMCALWNGFPSFPTQTEGVGLFPVNRQKLCWLPVKLKGAKFVCRPTGLSLPGWAPTKTHTGRREGWSDVMRRGTGVTAGSTEQEKERESARKVSANKRWTAEVFPRPRTFPPPLPPYILLFFPLSHSHRSHHEDHICFFKGLITEEAISQLASPLAHSHQTNQEKQKSPLWVPP